MGRVARLSADLVASTSEFETGMKRADSVMNNSRQVWGQALGSIDISFTKLGQTVGAFLAVNKLKGDFEKVINYLENTADAAKQVGISSESFSKLAYAAKIAEVPVDALQVALRKMQVNLVAGQSNPGSAIAKSFDALGLSVKKLREEDADKAFADIVDGLHGIADDSLRTTLATNIFGKSVGSIGNLLNKTGDQIRSYGEEAKKFGLIVGVDGAEQAERFKTSLNRIDAAYEGLIISLAKGDALENTISLFDDFANRINNVSIYLKELHKDWELFISDHTDVSNIDDRIDIQAQVLNAAQSGPKTNSLSSDFVGPPIPSFTDVQTKNYTDLIQKSKDLTTQQNIETKQKQEADAIAKRNIDAQIAKEEQLNLTKKSQAETYTDIISNLKKEADLLDIQVNLYGQKAGVIDRAKAELDIQNTLTKDNITLTQKQQEKVDMYLDKIKEQGDKYDELNEKNKELKKTEEDKAQAIQQLGYSFESSFEDAIVNGKKLGDVLGDLGKDIEKILLRMTVTQPLVEMLTNATKPTSLGGGGVGFLSLLSHLVPSFDVGSDYVPSDMLAMVHKGEQIIPADQVGKGGGGVNVMINNNTSSKITTSASQNSNGTDLMVQVDEMVANNITRKGSKTSKALSAMSSRSLTRR